VLDEPRTIPSRHETAWMTYWIDCLALLESKITESSQSNAPGSVSDDDLVARPESGTGH
jgi:hypothetical protein